MSAPSRSEPKPTRIARLARRVRRRHPKLETWLGDSHDVPRVTLQEGQDEVTAAIMAHVLSRPDSIRQRAQNAATISGALAAALVVAGLSGLANAGGFVSVLTTALVCLAILFFACSAVLSVYAVAFPHEYRPDSDVGDRGGAPGHYQQLVRNYEDYADEVRQKMRRAAAVAFVAVTLTALAVVVELVVKIASDDTEAVTVLLSADGLSAVKTLCPGDHELLPELKARAPADELTKAIVALTGVEVVEDRARGGELRRGRRTCDGTVRLPRSAIRATRAAG